MAIWKQVGSGTVSHNIILAVCGRTEQNRMWGKEMSRLRFAGTGPDDFCTSALIVTRAVWPQPDMAIKNQIRSGLFSHSMIQAICGRTEAMNRMRESGSGLLEPGWMIVAHWFALTR